MIKVAFFSSNRADLAFIYNLYQLFENNKNYKTFALINDISKIDFSFLPKNKIIKTNLNSINTKKYHLVNELSKLLKKYNNLLSKIKPDYIFIVGDRYEAFAMAIVCNFLNIKIIHIAGGDVTKGAYDDEIRTYISKSSFIHFVTNKLSKTNLLNLLDNKKNVFNYGSPSLDYIKKIKKISKKAISEQLNINFNKFNILITFHPETKILNKTKKNLNTLLNSLKILGTDYNLFFTGANLDSLGKSFNKKIITFVKKNKNFYFFSNLGTIKYIQLSQNCDLVIGNSSSIIYEIPFIGIRSILIGSRQEGRFMPNNIIKVKPVKNLIVKEITKNIDRKNPKRDFKNFGNGFASKKIFKKLNSMMNAK